MNDDATSNEVITTADGTPLEKSLQRALFREKMRALLLIAPLLLFVLLTFVIPIISVLFKSVDNSVVVDTIPATIIALEDWDETSGERPPEEVYAAFAADMQKAIETRDHTRLGKRLNYDLPGTSSKFRKLGREVNKWDLEADAPLAEKFAALDEFWVDPETWAGFKTYSAKYTGGYFANAVDGRLTVDGFEKRAENERLYLRLLWTTMWLSALITFMTFLLGYPVAYLLSTIKERHANLLLIMVLLPFWTSLLVRTAAWKINLQDAGILNSIFLYMNSINGVLFNDAPYEIIRNRISVVIGMTHILLPFMILPMYSVMKTIPPSYMRAAKSLGATDWTAFWRVYFPQSTAGVGAGALLVFILAVGYYITPAILGGQSGQFISQEIYRHISNNQGLGAALAAILLVIVLVLYYVYDRLVGIDKLKLG